MSKVREKLAIQQSALVASLTGLETPPPGFDAARLQAAADALARKRRRAVAKAWPMLTEALGASFLSCFDVFASTALLPADGALPDGRNFARWLAHRQPLPDAARMEVLVYDLRQAASRFKLKTIWLREQRRMLIGLRLPWLGVRICRFPLGIFGRRGRYSR